MTEQIEQDVAEVTDDGAEALLKLVRQLTLELHPQGVRTLHVSLGSSLDRDLGFDSLSRVELLLRLERTYGVTLPERLLAEAETPHDLWRAVQIHKITSDARPIAEARSTPLDELADVPYLATTLPEILHWHLQRHSERPHVYLYGDGDEPETITYAVLAKGAQAIAAGLQANGLLSGQSVAIMLPTSRDYLFSFFGILLAGGVPVPIYPPLRPSQLEDHLRRHAKILDNARAVQLITVAEAQRVGHLLQGQVDSLHKVVTPTQLTANTDILITPTIQADDTAFLQYTSGSTGQPKGVILSHANLLANIRAMGEAVQADSTDIYVSWLPLYHDMGLIGAWLSSLYHGMPLVLMSPLAFLTRPARWLWTIHKHRATLTAAPNFAYELCLNKVQDSDIQGLDLGSLRMVFNGAEPVSPNTIHRFAERFAAYGFQQQVMAPVYGLAETAVGLAFPPVGRGPLVDRIQREAFTIRGQAVPAADTNQGVLEFVACGQPLVGYQIRIVDGSSRELPEREQGRLEFKGPSATSGYLRNPEATQHLFDGAWLDSGDLAYVAGGDVYLTGRLKDIIIRGGRNIYPHELEEAIGNIDGIRKGCVVVFGSTDSRSGTERLVVIAETRELKADRLELLQTKIRSKAIELLDMPLDEVLLESPHTVLKTSSGKIRRSAMRELFESGDINRQQRAVWWQVVRLTLASLRPSLRSARQHLSNITYAAYAHLIFWLLAPPAWLLIILLPRADWRWRVMRQSARLFFRLSRLPIMVEGQEQLLRKQTCVIVSNHASYLDALLLVAFLPTDFSFAVKVELKQYFVTRLFLQRIGTLFVERFDTQRSVADSHRTVQMLQAGQSLMIFPEGTFTRMPGLLPFHLGAFIAAAEAGVPVIPVTIRGTRSLLRAGTLFPHRAAMRVSVAAPIQPKGTDWAAAVKLRDATRASILQHLGEPDLALEPSHLQRP